MLFRITLPAIADVIATALLLRTIWVANSLDVILVMTGGGPGYATHTLPLYAFIRAYSGMEFGYGAALALVLTALLLVVVWLYVRAGGAGSRAMIDHRSARPPHSRDRAAGPRDRRLRARALSSGWC